MFDTLFQALFTYRPVVFQEGEFRLDISASTIAAAIVAGVVMTAAVVTYRGVRITGRLRDRIVLTVLRMAVVAVVLFCLFPIHFNRLAWTFAGLCWLTALIRIATAVVLFAPPSPPPLPNHDEETTL